MKDIENKLIIIIFLVIVAFLIYMFVLHTNKDSTTNNKDKIYIMDNHENDLLRRQNNWLRRRYLDNERDIDRKRYERDLERVREDTQRRIRELEKQVKESNQVPVNTNGGPDLTESESTETFSNNDNDNLYLFYTLSCPHSQALLPIWYRIRDALPKSCNPVEKDCSKIEVRPTCSAFKITGVPTIILETVENENKKRIQYTGEHTYNGIKQFLRNNNIILSGFENTGDDNNNSLNPEAFNNIEPFQNLLYKEPNLELGHSDVHLDSRLKSNQEDLCPDITYDKNVDRSVDKFCYQIFNKFGQHGYSCGGTGEPLDKFHAAYNPVDTYLSSLPDPELMKVCAVKNKKTIRDFELCDEKKLNEVLNHHERVKGGKTDSRVEGTNYESNINVVNAIKKACGI